MFDPQSLMLKHIPYVDNGRSPETGLDCYGLVRHILKEAGIYDAPDVATDCAKLLTHKKHFTVIRKPFRAQKWDVLLFASGNGIHVDHVGIVIDDGVNFMHAGKKQGGITCELISKHYPTLKALGRPR